MKLDEGVWDRGWFRPGKEAGGAATNSVPQASESNTGLLGSASSKLLVQLRVDPLGVYYIE